jgi:sarcosine oxidase subunit beta
VARICVAGAGAIGASVAYHLALRGARDVVLVDRAEIASGSTGKAMGGVRQQFSTAAEVRLAQESIRFFEQLGRPYFDQVGYLFVAMTEPGLGELHERLEVQRELGVPVQPIETARIQTLVPGIELRDVLGGVFCASDGVGDPAAVTRELVRRAAEHGVDVRERTAVESVDAETVVIACGAYSAVAARVFDVELPVRPLCRQLLETTSVARLSDRLPMTVESETGFHFRRRDNRLVLAMHDPQPRWGFGEEVDISLYGDRLERLAHRFPPAADVQIERGWAGLYDMTPDAHPVIGQVAGGVYAACGFSGHGFMQSPAVGAALAEEILDGESSFDLSPYRLERFAEGATFPETVIL